MRSGGEIRSELTKFAAKWKSYSGTEKAEAQTYLNELFACYGSDRGGVGAKFEDFKASAGFMDLHWPGTVIVEMKAPAKERSEKHRDQLRSYWMESSDQATNTPAARWVLLCNFKSFEIWEPGRFPNAALKEFDLADLPDNYDSLMFLAGPDQEPTFSAHNRALTTDAVRSVATLYKSLVDRSAAQIDEIQRFVLQSVWCLFAEDLNMIDDYPLQKIAQLCLNDTTRSSATELGQLFRVLNQKSDRLREGLLSGTRYVNGELFTKPAEIRLEPAELRNLLAAAEFDWTQVDPTIFGSLMEGVLGKERRWELGAHYTHEADIMKIVTPTIIRPWRERITSVGTTDAGVALLNELCEFRVLDPACGCGNFLYVAYRELRALEFELKARINSLARDAGLPVPSGLPYYPLHNLYGLDIERIAVAIARITLWMGHRQTVETYKDQPQMRGEDPLPLVDLSNIHVADALRVSWPEVDAIIGNPPFLGASHVRGALGDEYVGWLKHEFGVGVKDYCVYWFRRAQDHLKPGQRAGLVGTNSISQNLGRSASLEYIVETGGVITDAISSQVWPGEAKVHVSIVNWIKDSHSEPGGAILDGKAVAAIDASLRAAQANAWQPAVIRQNSGRCFKGPSPNAKGLLLSAETAASLIAESGADYREVVRPYLTAADIAGDPAQAPSRWVIDFGLRTLEQAAHYPKALSIVRELVKPEREDNNMKSCRKKWWIFGAPRTALRNAVAPLPRHVASGRHGKRFLACWANPWTLASDATNVFAFADNYSMGILTSRAHVAWAWHQSSTLKGDLRYTPTSVFATFPWPDPVTEEQREAVAQASRQLLGRRTEICLSEQIGLTTLYNRMDDGAFTDLRDLHKQLDDAVAACYGWPTSVSQGDAELVRRLTALNKEITTGMRSYDPFDN